MSCVLRTQRLSKILVDTRAGSVGSRTGGAGVEEAASSAGYTIRGLSCGRSARSVPAACVGAAVWPPALPPLPRPPPPTPHPRCRQAAACRGVGGCRGAGGCPQGPCGGSRGRGRRAVAPRGRGGRPRARPSHRRTLSVPPGESGPVPAPRAPASARRRGGPAAWRGMPTRRAARTRQTGGAVRSGARRRRPTAGRGRPAPPPWRAIRASLRRGRPAPRAHPRPAVRCACRGRCTDHKGRERSWRC